MRKIDLNYLQIKFIKCRIKPLIFISLIQVHTHILFPYTCEYIYRIIKYNIIKQVKLNK